LPTRKPRIFNRLRKAEDENEYFVSVTEQICRTVGLVGVSSFDRSPQESEGPGKARLSAFDHSARPSLLSLQPVDRAH
jgi:hypothetical protein